MSRFRFGFLAVVVACAASACSSQTDTPARQRACIPLVGFYPSWRAHVLPVSEIDWITLDGVATGFVLPRPDGGLNTDAIEPYLEALVTAAHAHDDLVYVSIGGAAGYEDAFQQISRDPIRRTRFVSEVRALVDRYGLDGIDIDWEYWTWQQKLNKGGRDPEESPLLGVLLKELRAGLPTRVRLSTDIFAGDWLGAQYTPDILEHVDHVNLMAFDFTGAWDASPVGHHSSPEMVKKAIEWVEVNGFDLNKVWLGQPAYGIEFPDGKPLNARHIAQADIVKQFGQNREVIERGRIGHLFFDNPRTSQAKSHLASERHLGGVFIFELTSDAPGEDSLVRAARSGLAKRMCTDD